MEDTGAYVFVSTDFRYVNHGNRSLENNFYLIEPSRAVLRRKRFIRDFTGYIAPTTMDIPLLYCLTECYSGAYISQRNKRMAAMYQIELLHMRSSRIDTAKTKRTTVGETYCYVVIDNRDIWKSLVPLVRMTYFA